MEGFVVKEKSEAWFRVRVLLQLHLDHY